MAALNDINVSGITQLDGWIPEIWSKMLYYEMINRQVWKDFIGEEGSDMCVILKEDILNKPGDTININQLANLAGVGVSGETVLQGSEEQLSNRQITVTPEWYRHGVGITQKAKKRITYDFRKSSMISLSKWMSKKMDDSLWTAATGTGNVGFKSTTITTVYGGNATSVNTLDSSDTFGVEEIRKAVNKLENQNAPKVGGEDGKYAIFIHTNQAYTLIKDSEWLAANRELRDGNPIFTNVLGEYGGAVIKVTNSCPRSQNANSPVIYTSRAVAMGAEALCRGMGKDIDWSEQITDFGFKQAIAVGAAWADSVLNSDNIVHIATASVAP